MIKTWKERWLVGGARSKQEAMQAEIDELRAALAARGDTPYCYVPPERDGEFHHAHESITAYREKMAGWMPLYTTPQPAALMGAAKLAIEEMKLWQKKSNNFDRFSNSIEALEREVKAAGVTTP